MPTPPSRATDVERPYARRWRHYRLRRHDDAAAYAAQSREFCRNAVFPPSAATRDVFATAPTPRLDASPAVRH